MIRAGARPDKKLAGQRIRAGNVAESPVTSTTVPQTQPEEIVGEILLEEGEELNMEAIDFAEEDLPEPKKPTITFSKNPPPLPEQ